MKNCKNCQAYPSADDSEYCFYCRSGLKIFPIRINRSTLPDWKDQELCRHCYEPYRYGDRHTCKNG